MLNIKTKVLLIVICLFPVLVFSQNEKKDQEQMRLLKKLCADRVDAQNSIKAFSENRFNNTTVDDEGLADRILLFVSSGDHIWPTYDMINEWFMMPIAESTRANLVSWMHIIRSKEEFLRKYRLEVIEELDLSGFPWRDQRLNVITSKFNKLYETAEPVEKVILDQLFTQIVYGEFIYRDKAIDVDLIEFSLFNKNTLLNLANVFQERMLYHNGSFKEINLLFRTSPEHYEDYVLQIENKELNILQEFEVKSRKGLPVFMGEQEVSRATVMSQLQVYKEQHGIVHDSEGNFTNDKIIALTNIAVNHGGIFTDEDLALLFGVDGSGGLYNYLYQNIEWQSNYEDFFLLTILAAYQADNLQGRTNYMLVVEGAKYLGILGTGITGVAYKSDIQRKLDKSSLVSSKTSLTVMMDLMDKGLIGYSMLRRTITIKK